MHVYISTACHHDRHDRCRLVCKFCPEPCLCLCHYSKENAMTEPIDNPATPDADLDEPANPSDPGVFTSQEPVEVVEENVIVEPEGEPVVEPADHDEDDQDDDGDEVAEGEGVNPDSVDLPVGAEEDDDSDEDQAEDDSDEAGVAVDDNPLAGTDG